MNVLNWVKQWCVLQSEFDGNINLMIHEVLCGTAGYWPKVALISEK